MTIIGITGGSGGGKTSALRALGRLGALIIDCDAVYHELLAGDKNMLREIEGTFPGVVKNGSLDRKALGQIVFSDAEALETINGITHKYVGWEVSRRLREHKQQGGTLAAVDAIALIESGRSTKCDIVVGVTAPAEIRIKRIMERDGLSEEYAKMRISAQKPDSYFYENCDFVLVSDCDTVELFEEKCVEFFTRILEER